MNSFINLTKAFKYFHTVRHLKLVQIRYQLYYLFRTRLGLEPSLNIEEGRYEKSAIQLASSPDALHSYRSKNTFDFLNISHTFLEKIDWNFNENGKLWTYNLNYFEFLNQKDLDPSTGLFLIRNYIQSSGKLKDGLESFPISLRTIFWIKFLIKHQIDDAEINAFLYAQVELLSKKIEYHLLGNHLLENGFAFFYAAFYFSDDNLLKLANKILLPELEEQILSDGAHFELTPMYHKLMLYRVLDCLNLVENNSHIFKGKKMPNFRAKAVKMCAWLNKLTLKNGETPHFNDSTFDIALSSKLLLQYAKNLNVETKEIQLKDSAYRVFKTDNYELVVDVAGVQPSYIPGHAHADSLHFVLHKDGLPLIVDTGISTYEKNELRTKERSTLAHNTVQFSNENQSDVWGGFRVGKRVKSRILSETTKTISASCSSYLRPDVIHKRSFLCEKNTITITDSLSKKQEDAKARFHLHPDVKFTLSNDTLYGKFGAIIFQGASQISLEKYQYAEGYNKRRESTVIVVFFKQELSVNIQ